MRFVATLFNGFWVLSPDNTIGYDNANISVKLLHIFSGLIELALSCDMLGVVGAQQPYGAFLSRLSYGHAGQSADSFQIAEDKFRRIFFAIEEDGHAAGALLENPLMDSHLDQISPFAASPALDAVGIGREVDGDFVVRLFGTGDDVRYPFPRCLLGEVGGIAHDSEVIVVPEVLEGTCRLAE